MIDMAGKKTWSNNYLHVRMNSSSPAVTDTELQVGMFQVPPGWVMVDPDRDSSGYERVSPDFIAPASRFSAKVGSDEGFKGHRYHVLREQFGTDVVYYRM
jgi:hypothetical protein